MCVFPSFFDRVSFIYHIFNLFYKYFYSDCYHPTNSPPTCLHLIKHIYIYIYILEVPVV